MEWIIPVPEIEQGQALAAIVIRPLQEQIVPTTTTFKVFMEVIQLWRMQGSQPNGTVYFSDRQLAEVAGWSWSGVIAKRIREHLDILQGTSIDWEFSFKKGDDLERLVSKMHLLEEVTYLERRMAFKNETFNANHVARINNTLVQNMLQNRVRPINFEALRQISSDASTRLYMMLDLYLAKKPQWARGSTKLLTVDLGYEGTRYNNRGERKRTLAKLINDLDGKELTNGKLALVMEETADKKDWKLVARKVKRIERKRPYVKVLCSKKDAELLADELNELFGGVGAPKRGFLVFLCQRYPESVLRDALSRAKADYLGNVRKSIGAIFRYELEQLVTARRDLVWYKPTFPK
ncbi:hypothetical protein [Primorskyibacter sp. 2E233]|uniref:hypothetical protein n=1 Tax=Primorskyibacter sp. 2E233 TaxID=3413431 RepID=UPI003BF17005